MEIKNTAITATIVIQSLVKLLENEDVDISSVKFKVGSESNGYESPEFELEKLIDLAYEGLGKIKEQATPEGFVLVPKELSDEKATSLAHKEFSRISSFFYMENRHEPDSSKERLKRIWIANKIRNLKVFHKTFIEAQEQSHD